MPFSNTQVEDLLPHRQPFLFVDQVISLQPGHRVEGSFHIRHDHPFISRSGEALVFPANLVVEALGQVAAICIRYPDMERPPQKRTQGFLVRIDNCSFEHPVHAGEDLLLTASLVKHFGALYKFDAEGLVGGEIVVKASLTLYLEF